LGKNKGTKTRRLGAKVEVRGRRTQRRNRCIGAFLFVIWVFFAVKKGPLGRTSPCRRAAVVHGLKSARGKT
jgi:hypothetical protein